MRKFTTMNPLKRVFFVGLLLTTAMISAYALQGPPPATHRAKPHHHIHSVKDSITPKDSACWGDVTIDLPNDSDSIVLDSDFVCEGKLHLKKGILKLNHHHLKVKGNCLADSGVIDCDSLSTIEVDGNDSIVNLHFKHGRRHLGKLKVHHCDTTVVEGDSIVADSVEIVGGVLDISAASFDVQSTISMINSVMAANRKTTFTYRGTTKQDTIRFAAGKDTLGSLKIDPSKFPLIVASNLRVADSLCLNNSKLHIRNGVLNLDSTCVLKGFDRNSYIITGDSGALQRHVLGNGKELTFPIGTGANYSPVFLTPVKGPDTCQYRVHVAYGVLTDGLTGDSLHTRPVVKNTWHVSCTADSFQLTLKVKWPKELQTPGFNPRKCFISHYEHHRWDSIPPTTSVSDTALVSLTRTGIQSLSPFTVMSVNAPTSLAQASQNQVTIYPNPATSFVSFENATGRVILTDLVGKIQKNVLLSGENSTVDVSNLPAGLYLYQVVSNGKVAATGKLAVRK